MEVGWKLHETTMYFDPFVASVPLKLIYSATDYSNEKQEISKWELSKLKR